MPEPGKPENGTATDNNSEVPYNTTVSSVPKKLEIKRLKFDFQNSMDLNQVQLVDDYLVSKFYSIL